MEYLAIHAGLPIAKATMRNLNAGGNDLYVNFEQAIYRDDGGLLFSDSTDHPRAAKSEEK
jgi:hypothetical protein